MNINLTLPVLLRLLLWLGATMTMTSTATPITVTNENANTLPRSLDPNHSLYPRTNTNPEKSTTNFQRGALVMSELAAHSGRYGAVLSSSPEAVNVRIFSTPTNNAKSASFSDSTKSNTLKGLHLMERPLITGDKVKFSRSGTIESLTFLETGYCEVVIKWEDDGTTGKIISPRTWVRRESVSRGTGP